MTKIMITLCGKEYSVNCGTGEEARLQETVAFLEQRMGAIKDRVGNTTDQRLLVLTCITLADQLLDLDRAPRADHQDSEDLFVAAIEHLKERVLNISSQVGMA